MEGRGHSVCFSPELERHMIMKKILTNQRKRGHNVESSLSHTQVESPKDWCEEGVEDWESERQREKKAMRKEKRH